MGLVEAGLVEDGVAVLDEDLGEDVDGPQGCQAHGPLGGPQQVDPQHAGQVGGAHPVHDALLGHLLAQLALVPNLAVAVYLIWVSVSVCQRVSSRTC